MRAVRFLKHYQVFNVGEVAGFPQPVVDGLCKAGIAELVTDRPKVVKDVSPAVKGEGAAAGASVVPPPAEDQDQLLDAGTDDEADPDKPGRRGRRPRA
jgi:hypothetical protein